MAGPRFGGNLGQTGHIHMHAQLSLSVINDALSSGSMFEFPATYTLFALVPSRTQTTNTLPSLRCLNTLPLRDRFHSTRPTVNCCHTHTTRQDVAEEW